MVHNPWQDWSAEQGRAMDEPQGAEAFRLAVKRAALWDLIDAHRPDPADGPVLDLGGGTGLWALDLARRGHRVVLVDIAPGLLERARVKASQQGLLDRVELQCHPLGDLSNLPAGAFPLVLAVGAPLSYSDDPSAALAGIRRVTAPGGVLVGDGENRWRAATFLRRAADWPGARELLLTGQARWPDPDNPAPIHLFTPPDLRHRLAEAGWHVLRMTPSDVVASCLHPDTFAALATRPDGLAEALELERRLRDEPALLSAGRDVQFVARRQDVDTPGAP